jgi:hypothetical protein
MKISISVSILILIAAAIIGWHDHQRLEVARNNHVKLEAKAATRGMIPDPANPTGQVRVTKRQRENLETGAELAFAKITTFGKELEDMEDKGGPLDEAAQKRIMEIKNLMESLGAARVKIMIGGLCESHDMKVDTRWRLISTMIRTLARNDPRAALSVLSESPEFRMNTALAESLMSELLGRWTEDDLQAAVQWAMTLPPGKDRDSTLKNIHRHWPEDDPEGRVAFAQENGIK